MSFSDFNSHNSVQDLVATSQIKYFLLTFALQNSKYVQTQIFDSAFGSRPNAMINANQNWVGRDDVTELYFRDWDHLKTVFQSEYVRTKIGPDGINFGDLETMSVLMAKEKHLGLHTRLSEQMADRSIEKCDATVAMYFVSTTNNIREGEGVEKVISPHFIKALEDNAGDDAWDLVVNVGVVSSHFDLNAYFGGGSMPQYALVYKVFMKDNASVPALRKAQAALKDLVINHINFHDSFIIFGRECLILDAGNGIRVS